MAEAVDLIGSRTKVYELIGLGKLRARKLGSRTRIEPESLEEYLGSLPVAEIAPPRMRKSEN